MPDALLMLKLRELLDLRKSTDVSDEGDDSVNCTKAPRHSKKMTGTPTWALVWLHGDAKGPGGGLSNNFVVWYYELGRPFWGGGFIVGRTLTRQRVVLPRTKELHCVGGGRAPQASRGWVQVTRHSLHGLWITTLPGLGESLPAPQRHDSMLFPQARGWRGFRPASRV
jgi:hypothetical protein